MLAIAGNPAAIRGIREVFWSQSARVANVMIVMTLFLLNANSVALFKTSIPGIVKLYADAMFTDTP